MNNKVKWINAQKIEIDHWNEIKNKIEEPNYKNKIMNRSSRVEKLLLENDPNYHKKNIKILEVGGAGTPLIDNFKIKSKKIAIDPLQNKYNKIFKFENSEVERMQMKAEDIDFKDNSFDYLICRNCIDHVEDAELVLDNFYRIIRPDGLIYISVNTFSGLLFLIRTLYKDPEHPYTFSNKSFVSMITKKNFKIEKKILDDPTESSHFGEMESQIFVKKIIRNFFLNMKNYHTCELIIKK